MLLSAQGREHPQGKLLSSFSTLIHFSGGNGGESKPVWRAGPPPDSAALLTPSPCSQLNYTRPGLPKLNPRLLENWKNEVKEKGHINCPNNVRTASPLLLSPHGGNFLGQKPPVPFVLEHRGCGSFVAAQPRV